MLPQNANKSLLFEFSLPIEVLTLALRYSLEFSPLDQGEKLGSFLHFPLQLQYVFGGICYLRVHT